VDVVIYYRRDCPASRTERCHCARLRQYGILFSALERLVGGVTRRMPAERVQFTFLDHQQSEGRKTCVTFSNSSRTSAGRKPSWAEPASRGSPGKRLLHWLQVKQRHLMARVTSKVLWSSMLTYQSDLIQRAVPVRPLRSSDVRLLSVPRTRTELARRDIAGRGFTHLELTNL